MSIKNAHIVITGGSSGLGRELVEQLLNDNDISVIARASRGLDDLKKHHNNINIYEADLSNLRSVEIAADQLVRQGIEIDFLINNAAVQNMPKFIDDDFRYETIKQEIDINLTSACALTYLLLPLLLKKTPSRIININSGLALVPKTSSAIYCATKGALNILSQSLSHQLKDTNISVQQVFLPLVETGMTKERKGPKLPVDVAARQIIAQLALTTKDIDIGKVKLLRLLHRLVPSIAAYIMRAA